MKGEQSRTVFLKWTIPFRLKICCSFLHKKKKKKNPSLLPPPARPLLTSKCTGSSRRLPIIFFSCAQLTRRLSPTTQWCLPLCRHCFFPLRAPQHAPWLRCAGSSGRLFHVAHQAPRSGPAPLRAVTFHLFPPAHSAQDARCICLPQALHLPLSLAGMFSLHSPCFIPSLPSRPCLPITYHRILPDRPTYPAVPPSTLPSLCPESPEDRPGLFPH